MALKDTVERLQKLRENPQPGSEIIGEWRSAVSGLYDQIAGWLGPYVDNESMTLTHHIKSAHEDSIGTYDIDVLDIDVGPETVRLDPRGAIVIGARGRIDMTLLGRADPLMLVLTESDDGRGWFIVERQRRTTLTPLTETTFESALEGLLERYDLRPGPSM